MGQHDRDKFGAKTGKGISWHVVGGEEALFIKWHIWWMVCIAVAIAIIFIIIFYLIDLRMRDSNVFKFLSM